MVIVVMYTNLWMKKVLGFIIVVIQVRYYLTETSKLWLLAMVILVTNHYLAILNIVIMVINEKKE